MLPENRISILGRYAPERAEDILSGLDLLVIPSIWPENLSVGHSASIASRRSSMHVVAGWGGMLELVTAGENGVYFTPLNFHSLRQQLQSLLNNHELWNQLAQGASATRIASWDEVARSISRPTS